MRPRVKSDPNSMKILKCRRSAKKCLCFKRCPRSYSQYVHNLQIMSKKEEEVSQQNVSNLENLSDQFHQKSTKIEANDFEIKD